MRLPSGRGMAIGAGLLLVGVGAALVWPRDRPSARELVRRHTIEMVRAAEKGDLGFVFDQLSDHFRTASGMDEQTLKPLLAGFLLRQKWMRIFLVDLDVGKNVNGVISVDGKFIFARSQTDQLEKLAKSSILSGTEIRARFEKERNGEWRVIWADHHPLSQKALLALHP